MSGKIICFCPYFLAGNTNQSIQRLRLVWMENEWERLGVQQVMDCNTRRGALRMSVLMASTFGVHQDPISSTCSFMTCLENAACWKEISAPRPWVDTFHNCFFFTFSIWWDSFGSCSKNKALLGFSKNRSVFHSVVLFPCKNWKKKTPHNKSPKSCGTQCDFLCSLWEDLHMDLLWQPANSKQPTLRLLLQTVDAARNNRSICSLVKGTALRSLKLGEASSNAGWWVFPRKGRYQQWIHSRRLLFEKASY